MSSPNKNTFKFPIRNPYVIAVAAAVCLFALYCAAGFLWVPALLQGHLAKYVQQHGNMELAFGDVWFNPFSFQFKINNLTLTNKAGTSTEPAFVKAADIESDIDLISLMRGKLICKSLKIEKPVVTIVRYNDKKYNFSLTDDSSKRETAAEGAQPSLLPFWFSLNNITITDGTLVFDDRVSEKKHRAEKILLTLPSLSNFQTRVKSSVSPRFSAIINGSPVELTGEAALPGGEGENQTRLSFDLHNLDLPLYFGYLPVSLPMQLAKGTADGQIQISFVPGGDHSKTLTILFQMDTKDLTLLSRDQSLTMVVPTARFECSLQPFSGNIHLQNILFHEPDIRLKDTFTEETLDGFLPAAEPSSPQMPLRSEPKFTVDLLVMDNGTLHIEEKDRKKTAEKTYKSLQLSIKDYSGGRPKNEPGKEGACTFKLSGEQVSPAAAFSWQGELDKENIPRGKLELNRFPASLLNSIFADEKNTSMTGTADLSGDLAIQRERSGKKDLTYTISDGSLKVADLRILDGNREWLKTASATIGPIDSKGKYLDVGNVLLKDAVATLEQNHFPHFLENFLKKRSDYKIHGIDFSGSMLLRADENPKTPLVLSEVSFQANNLEKEIKDKENFAFSAKSGPTGQLKSKGTVALSPFRASLAVEFSGLQSRELFPWYTKSSFLSDGQAKIGGFGHLTYPENTFTGSLTISDAVFTNRKAKSSLSWASANLQEVAFTRSPFHLSVASAQIEHPALIYTQGEEKQGVLFDQLESFLKEVLPAKNALRKEKDASAAPLSIKNIILQNGTITLTDNRVSPVSQQNISDVAVEIKGFSYPSSGTAASFNLSGTFAGRPVSLAGSSDLFAATPVAEATLRVASLPVAIYKDQISPLLDLATTKGTVDLSVKDEWKDGKETGNADLMFHDLTPLSPQSDIALPLALLADKQDNIRLNLPLVDSSDKKSDPLLIDVARYFKRLIVKSVVAPLLLTDENFSRLALDEAPDFIDGESVLTDKGKAKLTLYRDLLIAHPRLKLVLTGMAGSNGDRTALLEKLTEAEKKRVEKENMRRAQEWQKLQSQKPQHSQGPNKNAIVEHDIPEEDLAKYSPVFPKQVVVSDEDMSDLAEQRTKTAYDLFIQKLGLGPDRIVKSTKDPEQAIEAGNRVRITLQTLATPAKQEPPSTPEPQ